MQLRPSPSTWPWSTDSMRRLKQAPAAFFASWLGRRRHRAHCISLEPADNVIMTDRRFDCLATLSMAFDALLKEVQKNNVCSWSSSERQLRVICEQVSRTPAAMPLPRTVGRRRRSANARSRGRWGVAAQRALWGLRPGAGVEFWHSGASHARLDRGLT